MANSLDVTRPDPRATRSREALLAAGLELVDERDLASISVREIVERAGVTRPTFYAHFGDLEGFFTAVALERLSQAFDLSEVPANLDSGVAVVAQALTPVLDRLQVHGDFYTKVVRGPGGFQTQVHTIGFLVDRLLRVSPLGPVLRDSRDPEGTAQFLAAATFWLIIGWLDTAPEDRPSAASMADRVASLLLEVADGLPKAERQDAK